MSRRRIVSGIGRSVVALSFVIGLLQAAPGRAAEAEDRKTERAIVVMTTAQLEAALVPENAGKRILVKAGVYDLGNALTVPDGATVLGEGVMTFDAEGLPAGFQANGRTLLRSAAGLAGDILTLGDRSELRRIAVEDFAGRPGGNPIVVVSRSAGDSVSAKITECEVVNPNPSGITPLGPTGRSLVVMTRNPNLGADPPPHASATLDVTMVRSILRSPGAGLGVFAINFAPESKIDLTLRNNVIGGGVDFVGGVSRPDAVTGSRIDVVSSANLYRSDSAEPSGSGLTLTGGATAPLPGLVSQASTENVLRFRSRDDRVEGFSVGVSATGGLRSAPLPEESSGNEVEVKMHGARLQSVDSDLVLYGAASSVDGVSAGDDNVVRVKIRKSTGSGPRANSYADSWTPTTGGLGENNQLTMTGRLSGFEKSNDSFEPPPAVEFFENGN